MNSLDCKVIASYSSSLAFSPLATSLRFLFVTSVFLALATRRMILAFSYNFDWPIGLLVKAVRRVESYSLGNNALYYLSYYKLDSNISCLIVLLLIWEWLNI